MSLKQSSAAARPILLTIPISHYGERARWALDLASVEYDEHHHLQGFSWLPALRLGGKRTMPLLVTQNEVLTDSAQIVDWASDHGAPLFPDDTSQADEVRQVSKRFADVFGVATRRFAYACAFGAMDRFLPYNAGRSPELEVAALRRGSWLWSAVMVRYLGIRPHDVAQAIELIDRFLDEVAQRLQDGRPYLFGERFTAADLTFAAMAAPCVVPDRYGVTLPALTDLPERERVFVRAWREHPAGRFASRLYAERPIPHGHFEHPLRVPPRVPGFPA